MESSILVARVLAVFYLSIGIGLFLNPAYYKKAFENLLDNTGFIILTGWIAAAFGIVVVTYHNFWVNDWTVLVTIIGWLALLKGIMLLAFPGYLTLFHPLLKSKNSIRFIGPAVLLLGAVLGYLAFFTSTLSSIN